MCCKSLDWKQLDKRWYIHVSFDDRGWCCICCINIVASLFWWDWDHMIDCDLFHLIAAGKISIVPDFIFSMRLYRANSPWCSSSSLLEGNHPNQPAIFHLHDGLKQTKRTFFERRLLLMRACRNTPPRPPSRHLKLAWSRGGRGN